MKNLFILCLLSIVLASNSCHKEDCDEEGYSSVPIEKSMSDTLNKYGFIWRDDRLFADDFPPADGLDRTFIINSDKEYEKVGTFVTTPFDIVANTNLINLKKPKIDFNRYSLLVAKLKVNESAKRVFEQEMRQRCDIDLIYTLKGEIYPGSSSKQMSSSIHIFAVIPKISSKATITLQRQDFK